MSNLKGKFAVGILAGTAFLLISWLVVDGLISVKADDDYMRSDLRAQVEELKDVVASKPTTGETLDARLEILWRWVNAFSFTGRVHDSQLTGFVAGVRQDLALGIPADEVKYQGKDATKHLDGLVSILALLDENRYAIGDISINDRGPFAAGSYETVVVTYTVGDASISPGGGVLIGQHMMPNNMYFQTKDASAENYVSIKTSRAGASFAREEIDFRGYYGRSSYMGMPTIFRLQGQSLIKGDTITVTYGDVSAGARGLHLPTYSNDRIPFQLYLDLKGDGRLLALPLQSVVIEGGAAEGVIGFAPSIVKPGEKFDLAVRSEDRYYNRATGNVPGYKVFLNGAAFGNIPSKKEGISFLRGLSFSKEGVYRFTFRSEDGMFMGSANPILVRKSPAYRIFWGETHAHSGQTEGLGTTEGFWKFGRDDAQLDFLSHTEHDGGLDDAEWEMLRKDAIQYHVPGKFIPFLAYEYSTEYPLGGHHNVLFRTPEGRKRVPEQEKPFVSGLHMGLLQENDARDVLVIPHAHNPGDWRLSNPQLESLTEIMSAHGTFEWFSKKYLDQGFQIGFAAGSDDHFSHPGRSSPWHRAAGMYQIGGLTAVYASEKTRDAIFDNMKQRRTYATTGERIIMEATLNKAMPGTRIDFSPTRIVEGRIIGTGAIDKITLFKNGQMFDERDFLTDKSKIVLPAQKLSLQLAFQTDSYMPPLEMGRPRGPRPWRGTIAVQDAKLAEAKPLGFENAHLQHVARSKNDSNQIDYKTITRGSQSAILLDITDAGPNAAVIVTIEGSIVRKATSPGTLNEDGKKLAPERLVIPLSELREGSFAKIVQGPDGFEDRVILRRIKDTKVLDTPFEFADRDALTLGDYYYVRVQQLDGALGWVTPVWVGGYTPR